MYIAAVLQESGADVKITDLCMVDRKDWKRAIGCATTYGVTVFSSSLYIAKEIAQIAKENNPTGLTVAGGPHPTSLPYSTLEFFDCTVQGEGEFVFSEPFRAIKTMPQIEDLNELPLPARDLIDIHAYTRKVAGRKATSITTSRGCPYSCAFCCKDVHGQKIRYFSIDTVMEEICSIVGAYGIKSFIFYDDTFALDRERFYALCKELKQLRHWDVTFRCNGDVRNNTLDDFRVLYEAGCREIAFGIESGSQEVLDRIGKGTTVKGNRLAIQNAKKVGLIVKAFLMIGSPGESAKTVEDTKKFMEEADPDQYTLFNFVPLPGCAIWKDPAKYGIKIVNNDFKNFFNIAGQNEGGLVSETEHLTCSQIEKLRQDLIASLGRPKGPLQDYYEKGVEQRHSRLY